MAITLSTSFLKTIPGILKIVEFILVLVVLFIARFGVDGDQVIWGDINSRYLGIGSSVGFAIIVPVIILSYLLGATPSILEFIVNLIGGILFISMGANIVAYRGITRVVGGLAISLGILFLLDFIYLCVNTRFTLYGTSRTVQHSTATVQHTTRIIRT